MTTTATGSRVATKWPQSGTGSQVTITYSYSNLLNGGLGGGLSTVQIKSAIEEALRRWAAVAPLRFIEVADSGPAVSTTNYDATNRPMIRIGHRAMDGAYGTIGYSYYPGPTGLSGDVHFDSAERWSLHPSQGVDLIEVAVHEIGHALGLGHSQATQSIMAARYSGSYRGPGTSFLHGDDIAGIRALYGAGVGSVTPLTPTFAAGQRYRQVGNTLYIQGTPGNDRLVIDVAAQSITFNNVRYTGNLSAIRTISFQGRSGLDTAVVIGSSEVETFALRPSQLTMTGARWNVSIAECQIIEVTGSSEDTVSLVGGPANDTFVGKPFYARLASTSYNMVVRGIGAVSAVGMSGKDSATLTGSDGDDTLTSYVGLSRLSGPGYSVRLESFETITTQASAGFDVANLTGSTGNDTFQVYPAEFSMTNAASNYLWKGYGFSQLDVVSNGGSDTALLYGSTGNDTFIGTPTYSSLSTPSTQVAVSYFSRVQAYSQGGSDNAYLYDSAGNDSLTLNGKLATLNYPGAVVQATNFSYAALYGTTGGVNRRSGTAALLVMDWFGSWV